MHNLQPYSGMELGDLEVKQPVVILKLGAGSL